MKEIGAIFVVSISEIRTVQLAAIKRRYTNNAMHNLTWGELSGTQNCSFCTSSLLALPSSRTA